MKKNVFKLALLTFISFSLQAYSQETTLKDSISPQDFEEVFSIPEVVVTALGVKKEVKKLGYDVTEVKGDDVSKVRASNPLEALSGKVAGLNVGASTEMLGKPQIVLRGSKDLLYIIDGVPISSDTWNLNANDIESYSILKGPNAAALYGSRGINGAIVITTKKGTKDKKGWSVEYSNTTMYEVGFTAVPETQAEYGLGTGYRYSYGDVLYDTGQRLPTWGPRFEGQLIKQYDSPWDASRGFREPTPWNAKGKRNFENFTQIGVISTNNISIASSGKDYDLRVSYNHLFQKGTFPNTKLNADNFNINTNYRLSDRLTVDASLNFNLQHTPNIPDVNYGPNSYMYMFKVYGSAHYDVNDIRNYYQGPQGVQNLVQYSPEYGRLNNPWFMANEWLRSHQKTDIYGYLRASYKISDRLNISLRSQVTTWNQTRTERVPGSTNLNDYVPWYTFGWYGDYREDKRELLENNTDLIVNYNQKLGGWDISTLGGVNMRLFQYNSSWATTKGLAIPNLYSLSNTKAPGLNYSWGSEMKVYSAFYSLDFGYKKYFNINTTGRVDNLSTLRKGNNTFFYSSASISSVLTDYIKFGKGISYLKVRASFANVKGALTSSTIGSAYEATTGLSTGAGTRGGGRGLLGYGAELRTSYDGPTYSNQNSYTSNTYYGGLPSVDFSSTAANSNLQPFQRISYEVGLDAKFLRNRLGLDFTYFRTINGPQIFEISNAPSVGQSKHNINGLTTLNQGFEVSLFAHVIKNTKDGFNWRLNANWSTYKETLKDIAPGYDEIWINGSSYRRGDRLDAYYGKKFVRDGSGNVVHNSAGLIYQSPSGDNQKGFLGNLNPDFSIGITNTLSYKNFELRFQWDARVGGKIYDFMHSQTLNGGTGIETTTGEFGDARRKEWESIKANGTITPSYVGNGVVIVSGTPKFKNGQITNLDELTFAKNTTAVALQSYITGNNGLYGNEEYFMIDRTYVKLREASFTYSFPSKFLEKSGIQGLSISLVGRNLLYFAQRKDMDLDAFPAGFNATDRSAGGSKGDVNLQSSSTRNIGFSLNLKF